MDLLSRSSVHLVIRAFLRISRLYPSRISLNHLRRLPIYCCLLRGSPWRPLKYAYCAGIFMRPPGPSGTTDPSNSQLPQSLTIFVYILILALFYIPVLLLIVLYTRPCTNDCKASVFFEGTARPVSIIFNRSISTEFTSMIIGEIQVKGREFRSLSIVHENLELCWDAHGLVKPSVGITNQVADYRNLRVTTVIHRKKQSPRGRDWE